MRTEATSSIRQRHTTLLKHFPEVVLERTGKMGTVGRVTRKRGPETWNKAFA